MTGINKKQMVGIFAFCFTAMSTNMTMGIIAYIMQSYSHVSPTIVSNLLAIAFFTKLICGDAGHVPTKFIAGATGAAFCFLTSFPIYLSKDNT